MIMSGERTLTSCLPGEINAVEIEKSFRILKTRIEELELKQKERISSAKGSLRSEFIVFMAYATLSTFLAGFGGAILGTYLTQYVNMDDNSPSCPAPPSPPPSPAPPKWEFPKELNKTIKEVNSRLQQCLVQQKHDEVSIKDMQESLTQVRTDVQEKYKTLTDNVTLRGFIFEAQMSEFKDVFLAKEWLFLVLLMGLFEVAVVGIVWIMWQKLTDSLRQKIRQHTGSLVTVEKITGIKGDERTLNQVRQEPLQKRVCVIAFHSATIDNHMKNVQEMLSQNSTTKHVTTCQFLVSSQDDILQLPPSKLYFVFVDFNERNVILEDPKKGLGNLRLTAVQAIALMGADVVLTYSREKGSNNLTPGQLYNTDLTSVKQHPELCRLERSQRMFSVFEKFNQSQRSHIIQIVKDELT